MYLFFNIPFMYKQNGKLVTKLELLSYQNKCFLEHVEIKNFELQIFNFLYEFHSTPCLKSEDSHVTILNNIVFALNNTRYPGMTTSKNKGSCLSLTSVTGPGILVGQFFCKPITVKCYRTSFLCCREIANIFT